MQELEIIPERADTDTVDCPPTVEPPSDMSAPCRVIAPEPPPPPPPPLPPNSPDRRNNLRDGRIGERATAVDAAATSMAFLDRAATDRVVPADPLAAAAAATAGARTISFEGAEAWRSNSGTIRVATRTCRTEPTRANSHVDSSTHSISDAIETRARHGDDDAEDDEDDDGDAGDDGDGDGEGRMCG